MGTTGLGSRCFYQYLQRARNWEGVGPILVTKEVGSSYLLRDLWARIATASVVLGAPCTRSCTRSGSTTNMHVQTGTSISKLWRRMSERESLPIFSPKMMMKHPEILIMITNQ